MLQDTESSISVWNLQYYLKLKYELIRYIVVCGWGSMKFLGRDTPKEDKAMQGETRGQNPSHQTKRLEKLPPDFRLPQSGLRDFQPGPVVFWLSPRAGFCHASEARAPERSSVLPIHTFHHQRSWLRPIVITLSLTNIPQPRSKVSRPVRPATLYQSKVFRVDIPLRIFFQTAIQSLINPLLPSLGHLC